MLFLNVVVVFSTLPLSILTLIDGHCDKSANAFPALITIHAPNMARTNERTNDAVSISLLSVRDKSCRHDMAENDYLNGSLGFRCSYTFIHYYVRLIKRSTSKAAWIFPYISHAIPVVRGMLVIPTVALLTRFLHSPPDTPTPGKWSEKKRMTFPGLPHSYRRVFFFKEWMKTKVQRR